MNSWYNYDYDVLRNEDDLKKNPKNEEDLKNEDNLKNEDDLKNEDNLKKKYDLSPTNKFFIPFPQFPYLPFKFFLSANNQKKTKKHIRLPRNKFLPPASTFLLPTLIPPPKHHKARAYTT